MENELKVRIEELEEENRQLKQQLATLFEMPHALGLSGTEGRILAYIFKQSPRTAHLERLCFVIWPGRSITKEMINVYLFRIRKKLKPFGIELQTIYGEGYFLDIVSAAKLKALIQKETGKC
jgi:two-component system cell cycle response regulator CtrA